MSVPADLPPRRFDELAASRRQWIDQVLRPWCLQAGRKDLLQAEAEWLDLAGRVDISATLWSWAWERFPELTHPDLAGPNETHRVRAALNDGNVVCGFPDNRLSVRGMLVLVDISPDGGTVTHGPFSIDDITGVTTVT